MKIDWPNDKAIIVLSFFTLVFAGITLFIALYRPNDGTTFTAFMGLLTGFAGAILKDLPGGKQAPPPGSTTVTQVEQVTKTPPDTGSHV